ncbi:uncharacterized protein [Rhodnius prolixus]|uniref:uncharacterized protein n=1 Tax=Rhodnius prolixus TaxID=13249 RepID=UPI003D18ECF1
MKIIIVLFNVISIILCETITEDKAGNVKNGGEIISEKIITETKSVSSSESGAVGNVEKIQKAEDEKILDDMYSKGTATKDRVLGDGSILLEQKLLASADVLGGKKKEIVSEELGHHMIGGELLKKQAGNVVDKEVHHQIAAGHKVGGGHLGNHHVGTMRHSPIHLHGTGVMSGQNQNIQQVSEIQTTKIIHAKQMTSHQVSDQMGYDQMNPIGFHHPVFISGQIVTPHAPKVIHHKYADETMAIPVLHSKLPLYPQSIVHNPHEGTSQQLAAIRLINQQLQEALIQNQQAALVGLEMQRQLEIKEKQQKLLASYHIPHVVHLHEHAPSSRHTVPIMKPSVHVINQAQHHHVPVLDDGIHTSVNKHELSKMRHLANEKHSPHILNQKVVHNNEAVQKAASVAGLAEESLLAKKVSTKAEAVEVHGIGEETAVGKVKSEGLVGLHGLEEDRKIALSSKETGLISDKSTLGVHMMAGKSVKKVDDLKKNIGATAMIKGLDSLADETLKEKSSLEVKSAVIEKADVAVEKSLKDLSQVKKIEDVADESALLKSANVGKASAFKAIENDKKIGLAVVEGAGVGNADLAMEQIIKGADTVEKSSGILVKDAKFVMDKSIQGAVKKTADAEGVILLKLTDTAKNTGSALKASEAFAVAAAAGEKIKEGEEKDKTEIANIVRGELKKDLGAVQKREDTAVIVKGGDAELTETGSKINPDGALTKESVLGKSGKIVKEADVKKDEISEVKSDGLKAEENALKLPGSVEATALKATNVVSGTTNKITDIAKQIESSEANLMSDSSLADKSQISESSIAKDVGLKAANVVESTLMKVDVKKADSKEAKTAIKEMDTEADNSMVKPTSTSAGNVMRTTDKDLAKKSEEEVEASRTVSSMIEAEAIQKSEGAKVGVTTVSDSKLDAVDLEKKLEKKEIENGKQLSQVISVGVDTMDMLQTAEKDDVASNKEIKNGNVKSATESKSDKEFGSPIVEQRKDSDDSIKQKSQIVLVDNPRVDSVKETSDDISQDNKSIKQLKEDNRSLLNAADQKLAAVESASVKDLNGQRSNEGLKDARVLDVKGVNVINKPKEEDEKKEDILQKVDERIGVRMATTGGDISKSGPIFTVKEASAQKVASVQGRLER